MLVDDDDSYGDPTGAELKKALEWLCTDRSEDDVTFSISQIMAPRYHATVVS